MNSITPKTSSISATRLMIGVIVSLLVVAFGLVIYIPNCKVAGYEFHPQTWQVRYFEFWADPFTNIQLGGVFHDTTRISIDNSILGCLNKTSNVEADRWDLVELRDFHINPSVGPAAILVDVLTTHKYGWTARPIQFWTTWTKDNPKKAPVFWQAAHTLTIHQAYHAIPDLLDQALVTNDQFDQSLNEIMGQALLEQAQTFQSQGDLKAAAVAAQTGLQYDPENSELIELAK